MRWTEQALLLTVLISIAGLCCQAEAVQWVQVKWVNDGDTVVLKDGRTLRYIGINTPEIDYKRNRAEPYANAARQFNRKLVSGVPVRIEFERKKTDQYGRLLAYLFLKDDTFVNRQLLVKGYGYFYQPVKLGNTTSTCYRPNAKP